MHSVSFLGRTPTSPPFPDLPLAAPPSIETTGPGAAPPTGNRDTASAPADSDDYQPARGEAQDNAQCGMQTTQINSVTQHHASSWIFARLAARAREDYTEPDRAVFQGLPAAWICGVTPAHPGSPFSIDAADIPSLYMKDNETARQVQMTTRHATHRLSRYPGFMPNRGPLSPTGSQWRLPEVGNEPLLAHAARFGNAKMVRAILNAFGQDVRLDYRDIYGYPLLHLACWSGNTRTVALLLDAGMMHQNSPVRVDAPGPDGERPLHIAVVTNVPEMLSTLKAFGANTHAPLGDASAGNLKLATWDMHVRLATHRPITSDFDTVDAFIDERAAHLQHVRPHPKFIYFPFENGHRDSAQPCCTII